MKSQCESECQQESCYCCIKVHQQFFLKIDVNVLEQIGVCRVLLEMGCYGEQDRLRRCLVLVFPIPCAKQVLSGEKRFIPENY